MCVLDYCVSRYTTDSTENATPSSSTKSRNSKSSVQIQTKPKIHSESVPRDTEKSEFLDLVDFGGVAISVETSYVCIGGL